MPFIECYIYVISNILCEYKGAEGNSCHYILLFPYYLLSTPPFDGGAAIGPNCYYPTRPPSLTPEIYLFFSSCFNILD